MSRAPSLLATILAAGLIANTLDAVLAAQWQLARIEGPTRAAKPAQAREKPLEGYLGPIRARNVFRHGEAVPDEEVAAETRPRIPAEACTLPVTLLGALVVPGAPQLSLATLLDDQSPVPRFRVLQVGEKLEDRASLAAVRVELSEDNLELLPVIELTTPDGRRQLCRGTGADSATTLLAAAPVSSAGIHRLSDTRVEVDRRVVDHFLNGGLGEAANGVLVMPYLLDGQPRGFRFTTVQPGSLPDQLGLKQGDVVAKINGYETNTVEELLRAYQALKSESEVTVALTRAGSPLTISYAVR